MKLTEQEKETVIQEWGDHSEHILRLMEAKKGTRTSTIFNADATLAKSKEEIEEILNKKSTPKVSAKKEGWKSTINNLSFADLVEAKNYINNLIETKKAEEKARLQARIAEIDAM